ncbi:MAG: SPFH domain-containing protein [Planctomycetota bacterium]
MPPALFFALVSAATLLSLVLLILWLTVRYIPNNRIGIVEKLWSSKGSLGEGQIIALNGEAGYQADVLRGGLHFGLWRWQYAIHKFPLITIKQGKIGYVFSRGGKELLPSQTLGCVVDCNNFQDARTFLGQPGVHGSVEGQKGRQRGILREGVYAINIALFNVITEDMVYTLDHIKGLEQWQMQLQAIGGFLPLVISGKSDQIGIVTVHEGPTLPPGELIAPAVGIAKDDPNFHNNYQDIEAFLRAGGRRGVQYTPLIDGTYFLNRWFATVEMIPKQVVPIGQVGVVVSFYGNKGVDTSGQQFRHGERVHEGEKGVWDVALGPGKYAFNTSAGQVVLVPTTNFVLHWITGRSEDHMYDDSLTSIELITADAYEPTLPLSVVVHIDYQKAPSVIQRFGDVKQLITQTLDPLLSAYFRDVAHKKSMLQLIHDRDEIQRQSRDELRRKFQQFDIECVDVLIGRPESKPGDPKIENLLDQLRQRQFAIEQVETFQKQQEAALRQKSLNEAQANASLQAELTKSQVQIRISENTGDAELARARKQAETTVVQAEASAKQARLQGEGEANRLLLLAEAQSKQAALVGDGEGKKAALIGEGEGKRIANVGNAEAAVLQQKIMSYGDPRLYAMAIVAEQLRQSQQPLVPSQLFVTGGGGSGGGDIGGTANMLQTLLSILTAEKVGMPIGTATSSAGTASSATMAAPASPATTPSGSASSGK